MIVSAIKCDFCKKAQELNNQKTPKDWALVTPLIHIKGTPNHGRKELETEKSLAEIYRKRRDKLREKFKKQHICPDCVEQILTGKISLKIGDNKNE